MQRRHGFNISCFSGCCTIGQVSNNITKPIQQKIELEIPLQTDQIMDQTINREYSS